jgi:glycosyltransferase involved in cell wall biosynthesis
MKKSLINNLVYNRLADGIMVNARMIKDVLLKTSYMKPEKIAIVANGITIDQSKIIPARKKYPFTITSLAELSERKGFDFLIKGFARFVSQYNIVDAGLVIMGTGGQRETLEALVTSLGLKSMVTFTGFVKNPYPELLSSDVFALTSKNEGLPYATIEAALLDNAIITTKAGGIEEMLVDDIGCLYVDYGDEEALSHQINRLYRDKELRERLKKNARRAFEECYSLEAMEKEMIAFFRQVLKTKHHTS